VAEQDHFYRVRLLTPDGERALWVRGDQHIWDAATEAGIELPAICHQGRCLTCAGKLEGAGEVDQSGSNAYFPQDREAGYVLLCTGCPRSDITIRTHAADEMRQHRRALKLPAPYS
jgi:ferredoxin